MAEQEGTLALMREQASELRAARAQLERALAASTAEAAATIGALKASMERQTADALELEQLRWAPDVVFHVCTARGASNVAVEHLANA